MAAFAPEIITQIGSLPITNTLLHTLVVDGLLLGVTYYISKHLTSIPHGFQNVIETLFEAMYNLIDSIATSKKATKQIFPLVMTFFLFIFVANFTSLFPGFSTIGFFEEGKKEIIPLLRGATSDINVTFALAIISVVSTHVLSIRITGIKDYLGRYFSFNPVNLYVGMLELVAEVTKVISLSFRLFGNILAGEIALHTISSMFAFIAPLPFLLLESIVSIVQALVFSILTLVFMAVLTTPHHAHQSAESETMHI